MFFGPGVFVLGEQAHNPPMRRASLVFLLAAAWFSFFQPWGAFADPDAFYHAKMAALMLKQGPLHAFPWLDLTAFSQPFADHHFLFHFLLLPFVKWFGMFPGTQIAAVIFAAAFIAVMDFVLRRMRFQHAGFWTVLVAVSAPMVVRLSFAKASPIALIWFVLGMMAVAKRKRALGFLIGVGFALSHGGWIILLVCQTMFAFGEMIFLRFVGDRPWREALRPPSLRTVACSAAGTVVGTMVHPNFPGNIQFLWVQVVQIGLGTPYDRVTLGAEWLPPSVSDVFGSFGPFLVASCFLLFGLLFAMRKPLDKPRAQFVIAWSFPVAGLFALTFKSIRAIEYLVPALAIWFAALWTLVDFSQWRSEFRKTWEQTARPLGKHGSSVLLFVMSALFAAMFMHDARWSWYELHHNLLPYDDVAAAMQPISFEAEPGERVYHSSWDFFPQLFAADDRLRYVVGLDPTFLLAAHPDLSDAFRDLSIGRNTSTAYAIIHGQFGSRYAIVDWKRSPILAEMLSRDSRFALLYDGPKYRSYRVD